MAKRDKKKIVRVALVGGGKGLRGLGLDMAAMNLALFGSADPDFPNVSKETWEVAYPKPRRMNSFGIPMIVGTGGDTSKSAKYYKDIWDESEKPGNVFIPMFGIDPYEFDKEAQGSWYDQAERSADKKQMGLFQRYQDYLKENPPMDYSDPITKERLKEIINKLSKQ